MLWTSKHLSPLQLILQYDSSDYSVCECKEGPWDTKQKDEGKHLASFKYKNTMSPISLMLPIVFKWLNYKILEYERDSLGHVGEILWPFEEVHVKE